MSDARDCVVKLVDDHGVEHSVRVRAESVYEASRRQHQKSKGATTLEKGSRQSRCNHLRDFSRIPSNMILKPLSQGPVKRR
jgi:hypothetical protein